MSAKLTLKSKRNVGPYTTKVKLNNSKLKRTICRIGEFSDVCVRVEFAVAALNANDVEGVWAVWFLKELLFSGKFTLKIFHRIPVTLLHLLLKS